MSENSQPLPLGALPQAGGSRFSVFSSVAERVWLCLFDQANGARETERTAMASTEPGLWTAWVPGCDAGQLYGYRVEGPFDPSRGLRANPAKLLFDPYARDTAGTFQWCNALFEDPDSEAPRPEDSAPYVAKARVVATLGDELENRPRTPWADTVLYEAHVKGMTALHPGLPPELRGTFAGLGHPLIVEPLRRLGVTAVELLPVAFSVTEPRLHRLGLTNYWGYNPLGLFAPDRRLAATADPVGEFRAMVRTLHEAGLEVILDGVFNHTVEGDHRGPVLGFRGLDNEAYYRLQEDRSRYEDFSGCGNTLNLRHAATRRLVLDALRYWGAEMGVDGFRFDLAPSLGRTEAGFEADAPFFQELRDDPLLRDLKLIAEPWDLGPGGYRLGSFPAPWREWNDRYRDRLRAFWRQDPKAAAGFVEGLRGSPGIFPDGGSGTLNFVTCHDGFTLRDLVSYEKKHNEANGEDGRDGHGHNLSRNWGVEGPSADPALAETRLRVQRALLASLAFSAGPPMFLQGDELSHSQGGNNNAYCQDNATTWLSWDGLPPEADLSEFLSHLLDLRRLWPELRSWPGDLSLWDAGPEGEPFPVAPAQGGPFAIFLSPRGEAEPQPAAGPRSAAKPAPRSLLLVVNPGSRDEIFPLPATGHPWSALLDTALFPDIPASGGGAVKLLAHSLQLYGAEDSG